MSTEENQTVVELSNNETSKSEGLNNTDTLDNTDVLQVVDELDDQTFDNQDDAEEKPVDFNEHKYTKIDCLDEDEPIRGQSFVLLSFISPEGIMNCKTRGLKVRGVYATELEARSACEKLRKKDEIFDILVGEVGKWLPWNPSSKQVQEVNYSNKKQNKIMQRMHAAELANLNELVGRNKEMVAKEKKAHKNRVRNSIKDNIENMEDAEKDEKEREEKEKEEKKVKVPKKRGRVDNEVAIRERMRKKLEANQKKKVDEGEYFKNKEALVSEEKMKAKNEEYRLIENEAKINDLEKKTEYLDDRLAKMKEIYNKKKLEKKLQAETN